MTFQKTLAVILISAATSVGSLIGYTKYTQSNNPSSSIGATSSTNPARFASYDPTSAGSPMVDFEMAATKAAPAVVHIKTLTKGKQVAAGPDMGDNPFKQFFGDGNDNPFGGNGPMTPRDQRASGSGVMISSDGYIVTNNHVVDGADEVVVTLNNKKDYKAKVVGKDASTDLAVVKIEGANFKSLEFANSDNVHLGQWVLAIGYPLNLETTVTSGIVSAKGRNLGINSRQSASPIESFIQTDAAVNPGNSGGALVNTNGDVIGINSAIASPTGSYAGYSYAIPSNLVQKVASDLIKYGSSKRAYLGVMYGNDQMSEEDRIKNNVKEGDGIYVMDVARGSAAAEAGVQKGDFITSINGAVVNTGTEMVEKIATARPGDKISIGYSHNGAAKTASVTLKATAGAYESMKQKVVDQLGATFENLNKSQAAQLQIPYGVVISNIGQGIIAEQTRIKEGFIVTKVNNSPVRTVEELQSAIKNAGKSAILTGVYPAQPQTEYQYALNDLQ